MKRDQEKGRGGDKLAPEIESINAITLATHDMARAVAFYRALGFGLCYGGSEAGFTSFQAGSCYVNLTLQPPEKAWSWWGRVIFSPWPTWTRSTGARWTRACGPIPARGTPSGANATFTSPTPTATN